LATMISLETSASFLGVKNTGASTHRDNKLQLTASGLSELLPDFSGKDIFVVTGSFKPSGLFPPALQK
ncbi:hypothetical protein P8J62_003848, partial [Escherichia coli]|nr:hypothetical protein [Escherichia coli]